MPSALMGCLPWCLAGCSICSLAPKLQSVLGCSFGWVWPVACNDSAAQGSATAWVVLTVFDMAARSLVYMVNPCGGGGGWAAPS
jgi:hypothetical protein